MNVTDIIILLIVAVAVFFAIRKSKGHLKGDAVCCGGGSDVVQHSARKLDHVVKTVTIDVQGMSCLNCANRVADSLEKIGGVSASVSLKDNKATVAMDHEVSNDELEKAIKKAGYSVRQIA